MRNDGGGFLKQVYDDHAFDLATGWHQYRNDPRSRPRCGTAPASPRVRRGPTSGAGRQGRRQDDRRGNRVDPVKRKALYAEFVKQVTPSCRSGCRSADLLHVITAKARNPLHTAALGLVELARSLAFGLSFIRQIKACVS